MEYRERKRWGFFALPFTFTVYTIKEDMITINKGFLNKTEDDCYMYKITDVKLKTSFWERIFGTGTIDCYASSDKTDPSLMLVHIKNAKEIKNFILEESEKARLKRRTVNTMNLSASVPGDIDGDGIPDDV